MSHSVSNTTITSATGGGGRGSANSDAATPREDQSGRGRGGPGRNRNRNRTRSSTNANTKNGTTTNRAPRTGTFKGATEGMNGHIFGCFDEHSDKRAYTKTIEALDQHATKTYKFPEDFASLFTVEPSAPEIVKPRTPPKEGRDEVDDLIFKEATDQAICGPLLGFEGKPRRYLVGCHRTVHRDDEGKTPVHQGV